MTRTDVRLGIATFFGGVTFDAASRIYRPTPLAAQGLGGVRPYFAKRTDDADFTRGLTVGRSMGAIMLVHLPFVRARRIALGGPTSGIKSKPYSVQLHVFHYAQVPHAEDAQADLDVLLQAIEDRIQGDRTLGGAVVEAGESESGITIEADIPVIKPNDATECYAVVTFDAVVYPFA